MPEGDTIHLVRQRVAPILEGRTLDRFWAGKLRGHRPRAGQRIEAVRVHGKHLLIDFDRDLTLQVHLGMAGRWSVSPGAVDDDETFARYRRNPRLRLYLATTAGIAMCYAAPTIQTFLRSEDPGHLTPLSNLGPDLCVADELAAPVVAEAVRRLRARLPGSDLVADALLDQEVAAGIGNVYKSEVLFRHRVWPFTPVGQLDDERLTALFSSASRLLWRNSRRPGPRRTTTSPTPGDAQRVDNAFVYERYRAPCRRCQTPIERSYEGRFGRSTYWCPRCQPDPSGGSLTR